jgi:hypothetical protein
VRWYFNDSSRIAGGKNQKYGNHESDTGIDPGHADVQTLEFIADIVTGRE